jgi:hypothetical protein
MPKPKASLESVLAQKPAATAPVAADPAPAPAKKPPKVDDGSITTSLRIQRDMLAELKALALHQRVSVKDVVLEAAKNHLSLHGRRTAA